MLFLKRKNHSLNNKKKIFILFLIALNFLCWGFEDTDEIDIFINKAHQILKSMEEKALKNTSESLKSAEHDLKMVEFTSKLQEILHFLKNNKFTEAVEAIENLKLYISEFSESNGKMRVDDFKIIPMSENRVRVDVKLFNDSTAIFENYFFKIILIDDSDNVIAQKSFRTSKNFIRPFEKIEETFYFFNIHNSEKIKHAEFSL